MWPFCAAHDQCRSQSKNVCGGKKTGEAKLYDFRGITLFCSEKRLSKQKMTIFSKHFGGMVLLALLATPMPAMPFGNFHTINI